MFYSIRTFKKNIYMISKKEKQLSRQQNKKCHIKVFSALQFKLQEATFCCLFFSNLLIICNNSKNKYFTLVFWGLNNPLPWLCHATLLYLKSKNKRIRFQVPESWLLSIQTVETYYGHLIFLIAQSWW